MSGRPYIPATREMAAVLSDNLRQSDRDEIHRATGQDPLPVILAGFERDARVDAWVDQGYVLALGGVADHPEMPGFGVAWLLASERADQQRRFWVRGMRAWVSELLNGYRTLFNFVDAKNNQAKRWLQWLGFTLGDPQPYGVMGSPFHPFWMHSTGDTSASRQGAGQESAIALH